MPVRVTGDGKGILSFQIPFCFVVLTEDRMDKMGLSLAQVGIIAGISRFLMFIVQPM